MTEREFTSVSSEWGSPDYAREIIQATPGVHELTEVLKDFPLPPSIVAAYHPETIPLFFIGLRDSDVDFAAKMVAKRMETLNIVLLRGQGRAADGGLRLPLATELDAKTIAEVFPNTAATIAQSTVKDRIEASMVTTEGVITSALKRFQLIYASKAQPVWQNDQRLDFELSQNDLDRLFSPGATTSVNPYDLSVALANKLKPDLSQKMLNDRIETFMGLQQLAIITILTRSIDDFSHFSIRPMERWLEANRNELLIEDDFLGKMRLLLDMADICSSESQRSRGSKKQKLAISGFRVRKMFNEVAPFMPYFMEVYLALGYPVHPALDKWNVSGIASGKSPEKTTKNSDKPARTLGSATVPAVVAKRKPAKEGPLQDVQNEIAERHNSLEARARAFSDIWRMSKDNLTSLKLDRLHDSLTKGIESRLIGKGGWSLRFMAENRAAVILGTLERVVTAIQAEGEESARELLKQAELEHQAIIDARAELINFAKQHKQLVSVELRLIPDPNECLQYVSNNWHIFRYLLVEASGSGGYLARRAQSILPPPQPGSPYYELLVGGQ